MTLRDVHILAPHVALAVVDGHVLASVRARPTVALIDALDAYVHRSSFAHRRFAYYLRVGEGASPPDERVRERVRSLARRMQPRLVAVSAIITIPGVAGAAIRGVITGVGLLIGGDLRVRAAADEESAALATAPAIIAAGLPPLSASILRDSFTQLQALAGERSEGSE